MASSEWKFKDGFNLVWHCQREYWLEVFVEGERVYPLACDPPRPHFSRDKLESEFISCEEWLRTTYLD